MDKISIEGLVIETLIGVHEWEKKNRQPILIDIDLFTNISLAANADDLKKTLSYGHVARAVTSYVTTSQFNLIETLAEKLAELILEDFPVDTIRLKVSKPNAVENADNVSVSIERSGS